MMKTLDIRGILAVLFILATIGFLLVIAVLIVVQPSFPLNLGFVRTTGRTGLLATVLPAVAGGGGLALLRHQRRIGAFMVAGYCTFWACVFLGGLPVVWNAQQSFCLKGLNFCITSPWVARGTIVAVATPFLLSAWWALRQAANPFPRRVTASHA